MLRKVPRVSQLPMPGHPVPPPPPPWSPRYNSPHHRLRLAQVGVVATMASAVLLIGVSVATAIVADAAIDLDPAGRAAEVTALDVPQEVVDRIVLTGNIALAASAVTLLSLTLGIIGVLRWQAGALGNFPALAVPPPRYGPVAAVLVWIVPVLNLFRPKQTFDEIWRSGEVGLRAYPTVEEFRRVPVPRLILGWWLLWIGGNVLGSISFRLPLDTLGHLTDSAWFDVVIQLTTFASGLCFLRILRQAGDRQDARYAALTRPAPGASPDPTESDSGTSDAWWEPGPAAWTSP